MLFPTSQKPRTRDTMMMTWSVWVSIQCRSRARNACAGSGRKPGVDLHRQDRGCGDDAEQCEGKVTLPGRELGLDDDRHAGGDQRPGLGERAEPDGVPGRHVVNARLPSRGLFSAVSACPSSVLAGSRSRSGRCRWRVWPRGCQRGSRAGLGRIVAGDQDRERDHDRERTAASHAGDALPAPALARG